MAYETFFWFRAVLAVLLLGYAASTIYRFASASPPQSLWEIVFWALGPPLWFFLEYFILDRGWIKVPDPTSKDAFLKSIKDYADYASKIWAAVLAAVLFLYAKKYVSASFPKRRKGRAGHMWNPPVCAVA